MHEKHASAPLPRRAIDSRHRFVAAANSDLLASTPKAARAPPDDMGNRIGSELPGRRRQRIAFYRHFADFACLERACASKDLVARTGRAP
jgi:hypothetical protein